MASNPFGPAPTQQPAKSPRRRQGALNDHGANPIKQRQATLKVGELHRGPLCDWPSHARRRS